MANVRADRLLKIPAEPSPELLIPALQLKREWSPWPEFGSDPGNPRDGRVKGTIRAVHVKLQNGGAVEGDIFHRSLSIDENSQFEGSSRRVENPIDSSSSVDPKGPQKKDMQNPVRTPLPSIDADLRRVERWFAHSCAQMASQPESPAMR
jgi:hypothetical protein